MGQVLVNLLDNAARHAPAHSVITVTGERRGTNVVLSVADQGPGVPLADRETIFDRFTQLGTGGRAGLGLTIAKTFVEAHGERRLVRRGPRRWRDALCSRCPSLATATTRLDMAHILVIDDDTSLLRALRLGLEAEGHDVSTRSERRTRHVPNRPALPRHRGARHRSARHGRTRGHAAHSSVERRADHHPLRHRRRSPQDRRAQWRRRRLRHQALQHGRTGSANPSGPAKPRRRSDRGAAADLDLGSLHVDLRSPRGAPQRRESRPHRRKSSACSPILARTPGGPAPIR